MNIYETIEKNMKNLKSVYDLAAVCYDYLLERIDNQIGFIGQYVEFSDNAKQNNPNRKNLLKFSDEIKSLLLSAGYWNDWVLNKILSMTFSVENRLKPFGEDIYNETAIAYFLLMGIDLYAECKFENSQNAPLNQSYQESSFIYRRQRTSIVSSAAEEIGFRETIQAVEIRNSLICLKILEKSEMKPGMQPPKLVTLSIDKEDFVRNSLIQDQTLTVASIPWGKEQICKFPKTYGNAFRVKYLNSYKTNCVKKALSLLESAIRHKANIVIFQSMCAVRKCRKRLAHILRKPIGIILIK